MNRDDYLADVAARLPLPEARRAEVLEELAAHFGDGVADLVGQGRSPEEAETEVLRRLGPTEDLAHGLARAHQSRDQLLAAAGAGVIAALRSGLFGAIAAWLIVAAASIFATVGLQYLRPVLGLPEWSGWTSGWNSVVTGIGFSIGAALAGAAAVRAVATHSWRTTSEVRLAVALLGALIIAFVALVSVQEALNWASVIAYLAIPVAFVVGVRYDRFTRLRWRHALVGTTLLLVATLAIGAAGGFTVNRIGGSFSYTDQEHGYGMIAPWWQDPELGDQDIVESEMGWGTPGINSVTISATSAAALERFSDFRLEAWKAEAPQDGSALVPGQHGPFAIYPANVDGATVSGTIGFHSEPNVDWAEVVLTAIGPGGHRYLLWASGPQQSEFYGSVASWFAAITR